MTSSVDKAGSNHPIVSSDQTNTPTLNLAVGGATSTTIVTADPGARVSPPLNSNVTDLLAEPYLMPSAEDPNIPSSKSSKDKIKRLKIHAQILKDAKPQNKEILISLLLFEKAQLLEVDDEITQKIQEKERTIQTNQISIDEAKIKLKTAKDEWNRAWKDISVCDLLRDSVKRQTYNEIRTQSRNTISDIKKKIRKYAQSISNAEKAIHFELQEKNSNQKRLNKLELNITKQKAARRKAEVKHQKWLEGQKKVGFMHRFLRLAEPKPVHEPEPEPELEVQDTPEHILPSIPQDQPLSEFLRALEPLFIPQTLLTDLSKSLLSDLLEELKKLHQSIERQEMSWTYSTKQPKAKQQGQAPSSYLQETRQKANKVRGYVEIILNRLNDTQTSCKAEYLLDNEKAKFIDDINALDLNNWVISPAVQTDLETLVSQLKKLQYKKNELIQERIIINKHINLATHTFDKTRHQQNLQELNIEILETMGALDRLILKAKPLFEKYSRITDERLDEKEQLLDTMLVNNGGIINVLDAEQETLDELYFTLAEQEQALMHRIKHYQNAKKYSSNDHSCLILFKQRVKETQVAVERIKENLARHLRAIAIRIAREEEKRESLIPCD